MFSSSLEVGFNVRPSLLVNDLDVLVGVGVGVVERNDLLCNVSGVGVNRIFSKASGWWHG